MAATLTDKRFTGPEWIFERKLDGIRLLAFKKGRDVQLFSRNQLEQHNPAIADAISGLPHKELILDGEVIALMSSGRPRSFQDTMRRFGRRIDDDALRAALPLTPFVFDILYHDGSSLIDQPLSERLERLDRIIPSEMRVPRIATTGAGASLTSPARSARAAPLPPGSHPG